MSTISITITESPLQKVSGIPVTVLLETNIPATIFYTLDESEPSFSSMIVTGAIALPTDQNTVILKAFATDGETISPVITESYYSSTVIIRQSHDKITELSEKCTAATYPYGSNPPNPEVVGVYGNIAGKVVDNPLSPRVSDGFDGLGTGTSNTFLEPPKSQFSWLYSETDSIGQTGHGIGTLPAAVTSFPTNNNEVQQYTDANSAFFNPRALVIFQDSSKPQYDEDVPRINRPSFDLEDPGKVRDGNMLFVSEGTPFGSVLKSQFNPRDNTINYYYYDSRMNRWIISKETYVPKSNGVGNLSGMVFRSSRNSGVGLVFKWIPFKYHTLI